MTTDEVLTRAASGRRLSAAEASALADYTDLRPLMRVAAALRDAAHGTLVSYSRKVFIPLTQLCRDVCHYCTFAHPPRRGEPAYLDADQVLAIARAGARAGCREALFTLGDKPELRYGAGDRQHLVGVEIGGLAKVRRVRKGTIMADVAAQLGQRDKDLARIGDEAAMRLVAQCRRDPHQRPQFCTLGERQRFRP